jgi:hypothetical protein
MKTRIITIISALITFSLIMMAIVKYSTTTYKRQIILSQYYSDKNRDTLVLDTMYVDDLKLKEGDTFYTARKNLSFYEKRYVDLKHGNVENYRFIDYVKDTTEIYRLYQRKIQIYPAGVEFVPMHVVKVLE